MIEPISAGILWALANAAHDHFVEEPRQRRKQYLKDLFVHDPAKVLADAKFANTELLEKHGAFHFSPWMLGSDPKSGRTAYHHPKPGMLKPQTVFGNMGSLKTSASQIPLGLLWPFSLIILEATGETTLTTIYHRRKYGPCYQLNPTNAYGQYLRGIKRVRYNPMDILDPTQPDSFGLRAGQLAAGLCPMENTHEKYWDNSSRGLSKVVSMAESFLMRKGANPGRVARIIFEVRLPISGGRYRKSTNLSCARASCGTPIRNPMISGQCRK